MSKPSKRLVEQRIRNRIIEYLELASSFEFQAEYDRGTIAHVPHEVIDQWGDWNPTDESVWPGRLGPPYSEAEIDAMRAFDAAWRRATDSLPRSLPALSEVQKLPPWGDLRDAAASALMVFERRGPMSEEVEEPDVPPRR